MTRILTTLAALSLTLLVISVVVGFMVGDLYNQPTDETLRWATIHRLTGTAAALVVVLVESIIVTYFIGTSRWCKEVAVTYQLGAESVLESNRLKRRAFAVALAGMLAVVVIIALGGANDPATGRPTAAAWTNYHLFGAIAGSLFIAWTFVVAWGAVWHNQAIIDRIVAEVARIRRERGLDQPGPAAPEELGIAGGQAANPM